MKRNLGENMESRLPPGPMKDINIRDIMIGKSEEGLEIIYIPDQTQILHEGKKYRFIINSEKIKIREIK